VFLPCEKVFSPKREYGRPGENEFGASMLSRPISLKREGFSLKLEIFAQAKS